MSTRSFAYEAAKRLIAKLPLPIATAVALNRARLTPLELPLAGKTLAISPGSKDTAALVSSLEQAGAIHVDPKAGPIDLALHVLSSEAGLGELSGLHGALQELLEIVARGGRIVIISPSLDRVITDGLGGFIRSLSRETGKRAITVNGVFGEDQRAIAQVASFLCSDRASYITGQCLELSPGRCPVMPIGKLQVAVVTGGARGIGEAIVRALAAAGNRVVILDMPSQSARAQELCGRLGGEPAGMASIACDIRQDGDVAKALDRARSLSPNGTIDVLVNNAGITRDRSFAKMSAEEWDSVIEVDLGALIRLTRQSLSRLSNGARVVNVSSVTGISGNYGQTNYALAKGAVIGFTYQASKEVESRGISITSVAPGLIETEMTAKMPVINKEIAKQMTSLAQAGEALDVAFAVEFLSRRDAWALRGQTLRVDGGMFFGR